MHGDQVPPLNGIRAGAPRSGSFSATSVPSYHSQRDGPRYGGQAGRDHRQAFDTSSDIGALDRVNGAGLGFGQDRPAKTIW
jgi:hypothetical protein